MVRSYLIENRIRFDPDTGSGGGGTGEGQPDRFNPSEMRAREQRVQDNTIKDAPKGSDEARDKFASLALMTQPIQTSCCINAQRKSCAA